MVLENMVDADSVDDELEAEVADECSKFGQVTRVTIATSYELPTSSADDVKVFVEFTSQSGWYVISLYNQVNIICKCAQWLAKAKSAYIFLLMGLAVICETVRWYSAWNYVCG